MSTSMTPASLLHYISHIRKFERTDWMLYGLWMGTLSMLFFGTSAFLLFGGTQGVTYPDYVFLIPIGAAIFASALAIDDIGHRTLYKVQLRKGEGQVHKMIVITAVGSVVALALCYEHSELMHVPAFALIWLSLFYSAIDEALHWHRYLSHGLDVVEMWSHFFAIVGHVIMIAAWWHWYTSGYPGFGATLDAIGVVF